jgi:uncharacterized protein YbjQ (UPF0145 family)
MEGRETFKGGAMKTLRQIGSLAFVIGLFTVIFVGVPWHVITSEEPALPWWLMTAVFLVLGGVFLVLLTVALEGRTRKGSTPSPTPESSPEILLSNSAEIAGRKTREVLGVVQGHTVFAIWLGKDLSALIRLVLGGELTEYTEMMGKARAVANQRMIEEAAGMGADAIINVRYMTTSVVGSAAELLAYGTAVKLGE